MTFYAYEAYPSAYSIPVSMGQDSSTVIERTPRGERIGPAGDIRASHQAGARSLGGRGPDTHLQQLRLCRTLPGAVRRDGQASPPSLWLNPRRCSRI